MAIYKHWSRLKECKLGNADKELQQVIRNELQPSILGNVSPTRLKLDYALSRHKPQGKTEETNTLLYIFITLLKKTEKN